MSHAGTDADLDKGAGAQRTSNGELTNLVRFATADDPDVFISQVRLRSLALVELDHLVLSPHRIQVLLSTQTQLCMSSFLARNFREMIRPIILTASRTRLRLISLEARGRSSMSWVMNSGYKSLSPVALFLLQFSRLAELSCFSPIFRLESMDSAVLAEPSSARRAYKFTPEYHEAAYVLGILATTHLTSTSSPSMILM